MSEHSMRSNGSYLYVICEFPSADWNSKISVVRTRTRICGWKGILCIAEATVEVALTIVEVNRGSDCYVRKLKIKFRMEF
jgi:hypothetical protein